MHNGPSRRLFIVVLVMMFVSIGTSVALIHFTFFRTAWQVMFGGGEWKMSYVLGLINQNYVDTIPAAGMEDAAIVSLVSQLDPHSEYIPASLLERVGEPLRGDFEGIGVTFNMLTDTVIVQSVIQGGPSEKAGIQIGDRFLRVGQTTIAGVKMPQDSVVSLLRGPRGTTVEVEVERFGVPEPLPFSIVRDRIPISSVDAAYMANSTTGVIRLARFAQNTPQDFRDAVVSLAENGMERLVLDLRENGGGYLDAAHFIASQFLQRQQLIVYTEGRNRRRRDFYSDGEGVLRNIPLVVLIDEFSASASEIVAGAIQDNDRALIIGRRSFGKGLVQEQFDFPDGSGMRLTTARYYTPSGRCIQKPYRLGDAESYDGELENRWRHGEFLRADSVRQDTLQRYQTTGGRTVYGGGGIMPDIFVPLDTTYNTAAYRRIASRALHIRFAQRYVDAHRAELEKCVHVEILLQHLEFSPILQEFTTFLRQQGVTLTAAEMERIREPITTLLYANIGRGILGNEAYYPIMVALDPTMQKALEVLREGKSFPQ